MRVLLTSALLACSSTEPEEPPPTLEVVSQKLTYDSVARLGSHRSVADITRVDTRDGDAPSETTETIDVAWNSWTSFHFQRLVDGTMTFEAIAADGRASTRDGRGPWQPDFDGEMARMDVYTKWNAWDEALGNFRDRIAYEDVGETVVDGRPARRFKLKLTDLPEQKRRLNLSRRLSPHRLEGEVILDGATAVRLRATVEAVEKKVGLTRRTTLHVRRTEIGKDQPITSPDVPVRAPGAGLRRMPERPTPQ